MFCFLCYRQGTNHEGANAEGVETNEDDDKNTCVRLRFLNEMKPPIYHDDELKAETTKIFGLPYLMVNR